MANELNKISRFEIRGSESCDCVKVIAQSRGSNTALIRFANSTDKCSDQNHRV